MNITPVAQDISRARQSDIEIEGLDADESHQVPHSETLPQRVPKPPTKPSGLALLERQRSSDSPGNQSQAKKLLGAIKQRSSNNSKYSAGKRNSAGTQALNASGRIDVKRSGGRFSGPNLRFSREGSESQSVKFDKNDCNHLNSMVSNMITESERILQHNGPVGKVNLSGRRYSIKKSENGSTEKLGLGELAGEGEYIRISQKITPNQALQMIEGNDHLGKSGSEVRNLRMRRNYSSTVDGQSPSKAHFSGSPSKYEQEHVEAKIFVKNESENPQEPDAVERISEQQIPAEGDAKPKYVEVNLNSDRKSDAEVQVEVFENDQQPEFERRTVSHLPADYNPTFVTLFVVTQFFINLFVNIDMGILPAGSTKIKQELGIENAQFGFLGSIVYLGQTLGSILASIVLQYCNPKWVLGTCLFLNIGSLMVFTVTTNFTLLVICRMCTGLFQIIFAIFMPVYADVFGDEVQKSRWLTYLIISNPLGVVMGYGMCAAFLENIGWRWAFYIQSMLLVPSFLVLFTMPRKYVDVQRLAERLKNIESNQKKKEKKKGALKEGDNLPILNNQAESNTRNDQQLVENQQVELQNMNSDRIGEEDSAREKVKRYDSVSKKDGSDEEENEQADGDIQDVDKQMCKRIKAVLTNKTYLLMLASLTLLYYIIAGIQYWISDYMITVLGQDETVVFTAFAFISVTGPVLGVVTGGNITTCLGGFNSLRSLKMTCALAVVTLVSSTPVPFFDDFIAVAVSVWVLLYSGGCILPSMTGIMLNQVEKDQKTTANSVANFCYNVFGYLPAPFIYGLIYDMGEGKNARIAMGFIMFTPFVAVPLCWLSCYLIVKNDLLPKDVKEENEAEESMRKKVASARAAGDMDNIQEQED